MPDAKWLKLDRWLQTPAVRSSTGVTHSRWDFIRVLANQEGGAHVDPTIEREYAQLREGTLGAVTFPADQVPPPAESILSPGRNVVEASMRQIAHEVQRALEKQFSTILS